MTLKRIYLAPVAAILLLVLSPARAAEQGTIQATIPWDGQGQVFQVATDTMLFLGALKGVMYVENSKGELHEGFVVCPIMQEIDLKTGSMQANGHCEITASSENVVYAKLSCKGEVGLCEGKFTLTGGEGKFTSVSGSGRLKVRSPMRALIGTMGVGSVMRIASGLATIDDLKFRIP
jgi:hypothetical protein